MNSISDLKFDDELDKDLEQFGGLPELQELKLLEDQFSKTSQELDLAKNKLSSLEMEIKIAREEDIVKQKKVSELFSRGKEKELAEQYQEALDYFLAVIEVEPKHARAIHHIQTIKRRLKEAEELKKEQEREAKKVAKEALAIFESGKRYYRESNFEKALEEFNIALSLGGKNSEILEYRDKCEQRIVEIEEALNKARKESEQKKRLVNEYALSANAHLRRKEFEESMALLEKALLLMPDNKEIQETLRITESRYKEYQAEKDKQHKEELEVLRKIRELQLKVLEFEKNGDYEKAFQLYQEICFLAPQREDLLQEMKKLQTRFLEYQKMVLDEQAKKLKEEEEKKVFLKEHYGKGIGFFTVHELEKAAEMFSMVISIDPHYEDVENYIKRIQEQIDEKAKKDYECQLKKIEMEEVIKKADLEEVKKKNEYLKEMFEIAMREISEENYEDAVNRLEKCYSLETQNEIYARELEKAREKLVLKRQKEEILKAELAEKETQNQKFSAKKEALNEQAENLFANGLIAQAIEIWKEVIEMDATDQNAREGIIRCQNELKFKDDQKKQEELARTQQLKLMEHLHFEALVLREEQNYQKAIEKWEDVLKIDPLFAGARQGILVCKKDLKEQEVCLSTRSAIMGFLEKQEQQFLQLKGSILEGNKLFEEGKFKEALTIWQNISCAPLKQDS